MARQRIGPAQGAARMRVAPNLRAAEPTLPDYLRPGLAMVSIGINPSL